MIRSTDASNYLVATTSTTTASVTQKEVMIEFTVANKVFDGGVAATIMGTKLPLTGFFGTQTRAAVMKFQVTYLKMKNPTGLVLANTIAEMNTMSCAVEGK